MKHTTAIEDSLKRFREEIRDQGVDEPMSKFYDRVEAFLVEELEKVAQETRRETVEGFCKLLVEEFKLLAKNSNRVLLDNGQVDFLKKYLLYKKNQASFIDELKSQESKEGENITSSDTKTNIKKVEDNQTR